MNTNTNAALAQLRHLYANMMGGEVRDTAQTKRIAQGLLAPAIEALEQVALTTAAAAPATVPSEAWRAFVDNWMGEHDVVLKTRAYEAMLAAPPTITTAAAVPPEGWVMVPMEPTEEMKAAAVKYANGTAVYKNVSVEVLRIEEWIYGEVYEAMLAAAPKAEPVPAGAQPLPLLVRDIAADFSTTPIQVCKALADLGFGGNSLNMAVTPQMAESLRAHFGNRYCAAGMCLEADGAHDACCQRNATQAAPAGFEPGESRINAQAEPVHAGEYPPLPSRYGQAYGEGKNINDWQDTFNADQMRAYVDADRAMRVQAAPAAVAGPSRINLRELGTQLRKVLYCLGGPEIWALYQDDTQVRYLDKFENDFVDSALAAAPSTQAAHHELVNMSFNDAKSLASVFQGIELVRAVERHHDAELRSSTQPTVQQGVCKRCTELEALSVTNILLDVVPGVNGMGYEVYAKSVEDVEDRMTQMGQELEDWQLGIRRLSTHPAAPTAQEDAEDASDTALLNVLASEYLDIRSFNTPSGEYDADVGWRVIQHHMGKPTERVVSEVYKDDLRSAIRAAIARLKRDPYCIGALHEEDADPAARSQAKEGALE